MYNWQKLMEIGMGVLRIPPDQFWQMTMPEFKAAFDGYLISLGTNKGELSAMLPLSKEELVALQQKFPDKV